MLITSLYFKYSIFTCFQITPAFLIRGNGQLTLLKIHQVTHFLAQQTQAHCKIAKCPNNSKSCFHLLSENKSLLFGGVGVKEGIVLNT